MEFRRMLIEDKKIEQVVPNSKEAIVFSEGASWRREVFHTRCVWVLTDQIKFLTRSQISFKLFWMSILLIGCTPGEILHSPWMKSDFGKFRHETPFPIHHWIFVKGLKPQTVKEIILNFPQLIKSFVFPVSEFK